MKKEIWEYGKTMLEDGQIESLDDWSDDKEYVYSTMDRKYDYLWWEDEEGIHFEDRLYSSGIIDNWRKKDERKLNFKNLDEVIEWIKRKENKLNENG